MCLAKALLKFLVYPNAGCVRDLMKTVFALLDSVNAAVFGWPDGGLGSKQSRRWWWYRWAVA